MTFDHKGSTQTLIKSLRDTIHSQQLKILELEKKFELLKTGIDIQQFHTFHAHEMNYRLQKILTQSSEPIKLSQV